MKPDSRMSVRRRRWALGGLMLGTMLAAATGCGGDDGGDDGGSCERLTEPQAQPGDEIEESYVTFAAGFFRDYCTRCHSVTRSGEDRNGAPEGFDWDDEASIAAALPSIRQVVGVSAIMPPSAPEPSCEERLQLVRWIDAAAPGLD
jgi:uncharacterized membrane protein